MEPWAQTAVAAKEPQFMRFVDPILAELAQEAVTTRRVLERVPEEWLAWKPHAKAMSLGQLSFHVATTPGVVAEWLTHDTMEFPKFGALVSPESRAQILAALEDSVAKARAALTDMGDLAALSTWRATVNGRPVMSIPRIGLVRSIMLNHWYHHRGQLVVYLRILGVRVPPVYGPSADENPFA